jgi:histidinol-phosphate aminotransferase
MERRMINLADNTNAWGMPPAARAALAAAPDAATYPTPYADVLKRAIEAYTGFPTEMITTGCGSDDVLDGAMRAFGEPGDAIAYTAPTFVMIPVFARLNRLAQVIVPGEQLLQTGARIIYICSPNNPTGTATPRQRIVEILRARMAGQIVIVDEAYAEFAGTSVLDLVREFPSLIVTRTMSKAFGLAGLRVGYGIADAATIAQLERVRGPYKVGALSECAAAAALIHDEAWVRNRAFLASEARKRLTAELRDRGLQPCDSAANFVYLPIPRAEAIASAMRDAGVAVRSFGDPSALRITVGPAQMMDAALSALDRARRACA